jgi:hypothetical protein
MKPKKVMSKQEQVNYWSQLYLQAKVSGDKTKMKMFEALILKLNGKVPKL